MRLLDQATQEFGVLFEILVVKLDTVSAPAHLVGEHVDARICQLLIDFLGLGNLELRDDVLSPWPKGRVVRRNALA